MAHFRASPHTRHVDIEDTFPTKYFELVVNPIRRLTFQLSSLFHGEASLFSLILSSVYLRENCLLPKHSPEDFTVRLLSHMCLKLFNTIERIWYNWIFLAILTFCSSAAHEKLYIFKTQKVYYDLIKSAEKLQKNLCTLVNFFWLVVSVLFYALWIYSDDIFFPRKGCSGCRLQLNSREFSSPPRGHDTTAAFVRVRRGSWPAANLIKKVQAYNFFKLSVGERSTPS